MTAKTGLLDGRNCVFKEGIFIFPSGTYVHFKGAKGPAFLPVPDRDPNRVIDYTPSSACSFSFFDLMVEVKREDGKLIVETCTSNRSPVFHFGYPIDESMCSLLRKWLKESMDSEGKIEYSKVIKRASVHRLFAGAEPAWLKDIVHYFGIGDQCARKVLKVHHPIPFNDPLVPLQTGDQVVALKPPWSK